MRVCDIDNCGRKHYAQKYCRRHYHLFWRNGLIPVEKWQVGGRKAATPTCHPDRKHRALGLCGACYYRQYRGTDDSPVNKAIYELEASEWLTVKEVAEMLNIDKEWLETQLKARGFVHE